MNILRILTLAVALAATQSLFAASQLTVTAVNPLSFARSSQTMELSAQQLAPLGAKELNTIHVKDSSGKELVCQAVDTDGDAYRKPDIVIFQSDFGANETKSFTVSVGPKQVYTKEQYRAYGRFVRERFDDFSWENDRIAHRTYGKALETWAGEPLSSSTIDIWSKRTPQLVINDWYLTDDYHADHGAGADFYSAGISRGCGGSGLWADDRLWTSRTFVQSRVLANGPIRVLFELTYEPFEVNGISVTEVKRVSLDADSQLDRFQSTYQPFYRPERPVTLTAAAGIKKVAGAMKEFDAANGTLIVWEKMEKNAGNQGVAIVADPKTIEKEAEDKLNYLVLLRCGPENTVTYWAGFAWDKAGHIPDAAAWGKYVNEFAQGLRSPIEVSVGEK